MNQINEEKEEDQTNVDAGKVIKPVIRTKKTQVNYASPDCGSKILSSNPEAQHISAVLSENKDVYMLNPCSANIWFNVELCEAVQVQQIQLANYELFSSAPHEFDVYVSERYPAREWVHIGSFKGENSRDLQTFEPEKDVMFAKFVKIEMKSNHGNEHFCPLSILRVMGISMVDEFEHHEEENNKQIKKDENIQENTEKQPTSSEEQVEVEQEKKDENLGSKIINTIVNVVDSILGTEKDNNSTNNLNETQVNTTELDEGNLDENATVEHIPSNQTTVDELPIVTVISTGTEDTQTSRLVLIPPTTSPLHPLRFLGNQYNMGGPTSLLSTQICWFLEYIYRASIKRCVISPHNNSTSCGANFHEKTSVNYNDVIKLNQTEKIEKIVTSENSSVKEQKDEKQETPKENPPKDNPGKLSEPIKMAESGPSLTTEDGLTGGKVKKPDGEKLKPIDLGENVVKKDDKKEEGKKKEVVKEKSSEQKQEGIVKKPVKKEETNSNVKKPEQAKKPEKVAKIEAKPNTKLTEEQVVINPGGNQKESVLMRLGNRIRQVEKNQELNSAYLEDLSQRYIRQTGEMAKAFNRTTTKLQL